MDLNRLNANVNRLLTNIWAVISFLREFAVDDAKDVSITYVNADGSESVKTFPNIAKMSDTLYALSANRSLVGAVIPFTMLTVPDGYLECNGSELSRTTYSDLFTVIGETYGVGDGSTTFKIPDLRGEFIRGFDNGRGVDSGRGIGSNQDDDFKNHSHGMGSRLNSVQWSGGSHNTLYQVNTASTQQSRSVGGTETRPRNIAMMYCIKY